jgi:hypothetical protein
VVVNVVFSVGPYTFINFVVGRIESARLMWGGESGSPPINNSVTPVKQSPQDEMSELKKDETSTIEEI